MDGNIIPTNSIFEEEWWLNAVAEDDWEKIVLTQNNGEVIASFPIYKSKRLGHKILTVPSLTQTLGIYIEDTGAKLTKKLEREKKIINSIIDKLPHGYQVDFYLDANNQYVLPFIWAGFRIEPMFSYRIEDLSNLDNIWRGFKENIKTDIRKASKKVRVIEEKDIEKLIVMQRKTFLRQNRKFPLDESRIRNIDKAAKAHNAGVLLCAVDSDERIHSAAYFIFDDKRCYYIMGGGDPQYRNSGAMSLLIWEGIKIAAGRVKIFDFEGSMIEDIERFVRAFGAKPQVYYRVKKLKWILSFAEYVKPKVKKILKYK